MKAINKAIAVVSMIMAAPFAQAMEMDVTGNVALVSDYTFRGVSQTDEEPAIQGGFDVSWSNGFYVGTWASNVDFGPNDANDGGAQAELDFYLGYGFDVSEGVNLDFSYVRYTYPGDEDALNYNEFIIGLGVADFGFSLVYSDEYFGDGGPEAYVLNADYSYSVNEEVSLDFHLGYSDADEEDFFGEDDSYVDYSIGVSYGVAGVSLGLAWVGTDVDDDDLYDDRVVFSISKDL